MQRRWYWPVFALPGLVWLTLLFLVPFYAIVSVALGNVDPIFRNPVPYWNPLEWNVGYLNFVLERLAPGEVFGVVFLRTIAYVAIALALCLAIGYPVAYYIARYGGRWKTLLLVLLILPFWVSYLMRMLAWVNLLQDDGYVNRFLQFTGVLSEPQSWLNGRASTVVLALVYGYIPFLILPLYAALDRIDRNVLEAARDLGATPFRAFVHVTLPLSKAGILAGSVIIALPMFGDYYTPDLISASPSTNMIGNQIDLYMRGQGDKPVGAALVLILAVFLAVLMAYYLYVTQRQAREPR